MATLIRDMTLEEKRAMWKQHMSTQEPIEKNEPKKGSEQLPSSESKEHEED